MKRKSKYIIAFVIVLLLRLLPFRAPNLEPVMAFQMPISKKFGLIASFGFGFLSMVVYDMLTLRIGVWTIITSIVYGLVGVFAYLFFKKNNNRKSYIFYAIIATIMYDILTGLTIGPIFFGQSFIVSLVGQIPFTVIHLLGNISFAIIISPIVERWFVVEYKRKAVSVGSFVEI